LRFPVEGRALISLKGKWFSGKEAFFNPKGKGGAIEGGKESRGGKSIELKNK